jgi:GTP 3',8-cyclase
MPLTDTLDRPLRDLRVSVTDRCNFRCGYCMPREVFGAEHPFLDRAELLTFEEITRIVAVMAERGVGTVRITGGEPLLRRDLPRLVEMLAGLDGVDDLAMTTNGSALATAAAPMAAAGLHRVTVSLDSLDPALFAAMGDTSVPLDSVLQGLAAARTAGLSPIKVNAVIRRGANEDQIVALARFCRDNGYVARFIEYMDVGHTNGWVHADVVPAEEIAARVDAAFPIEPVAPSRPGETASRYRFRDGTGEMGIIASVTKPFCGSCTRARLSPIGELVTCLFATRGTDLRQVLRSGEDDAGLAARIEEVWGARADRYSEHRSRAGGQDPQRMEMSYIGG